MLRDEAASAGTCQASGGRSPTPTPAARAVARPPPARRRILGRAVRGCPHSPRARRGRRRVRGALRRAITAGCSTFCQHMLGSREEAEDARAAHIPRPPTAACARVTSVADAQAVAVHRRPQPLPVGARARRDGDRARGRRRRPPTGCAAEVDRRADLRAMLVRDVQRAAARSAGRRSSSSRWATTPTRRSPTVLGRAARRRSRRSSFQAREALMGWRDRARDAVCPRPRAARDPARARARPRHDPPPRRAVLRVCGLRGRGAAASAPRWPSRCRSSPPPA